MRWARLVLLLGLVSCTPKTATIQGDVYLVMKSGEVKRGAGNTVYLVEASDSAIARARGVCTSLGDAVIGATRWADSLGPNEIRKRFVEQLAESMRGGTPVQDASGAFLKRRVSLGDTLRSLQRLADDSQVVKVLRAATVAQAPTGVDARYAFYDVRPGSYLLFSRTEIAGHEYHWSARATVKSGEMVSRDLDNAAADFGDVLFCGDEKRALGALRASWMGR